MWGTQLTIDEAPKNDFAGPDIRDQMSVRTKSYINTFCSDFDEYYFLQLHLGTKNKDLFFS